MTMVIDTESCTYKWELKTAYNLPLMSSMFLSSAEV